MNAEGYVRWYARGPGGLEATDPIGPGTERQDFVLRSTYLPGVRAFRLLPHYPYFCCPYQVGDPRNDSIEVRRAEDFQVEGWTIGPEYAPEEMRLARLQDLLAEACSLGWITNPGICQSLRIKLERAGRALERGQPQAAEGEFQAFVNELDAQHGPEPGKHVTDNAYWLLKINAEYLLSRL